jgi:response regulator of citrate/malate metabolism
MEKKILDFFKKNNSGDFTIQEVSEKLKIHRNTAGKYMRFLHRIGLLKESRRIGMIPFYVFNDEPETSVKINET